MSDDPGPGGDGGEPAPRAAHVELYKAMLAAGLGTYLGSVIPGVPGSIASAVLSVGMAPMAAKIFEEWSGDKQRNGKLLMDSACENTGKTAEEIFNLASESPSTRLLFVKALTAATETAWDDKVKTLGGAMVQGLIASDQAVIDTSQMITAAITDIEAPHLSLLELLVCYQPPRRASDRGLRPFEIPKNHNRIDERDWSEFRVARYRPRLVPVLQSLFGTLDRHGLISWSSNTEGTMSTVRLGASTPTCSPTPLGDDVYLRFRDAGAEVPDAWKAP